MAMERERVREREEEPLEYYPVKSFTYKDRQEQRKYLASLPRIIHCAEHKIYKSPKGTEKGRAGESKGVSIFVPWQHANYQEMQYPIWTMSFFGNAGRPVGLMPGFSGRHRHWMEAIFYRAGGKYIELQDGVEYNCEGEGLVCVPSYCIHAHYFIGAPPKGTLICLSRVFEALGIADMEVFDANPQYAKEGSPIGQFPILLDTQEMMYSRWKVTHFQGEPKTIYDRYMQDLVKMNEWKRDTLRWIAADSVPWENTRFGKMKYLIHPWSKSVIRTLDAYLQELPPGGRSGKHRHLYEEVVYCASGQGYTMMNEVKYEWKEADLCCIPMGVTHQHFNTDTRNPTKLYGVHPRAYMFIGHGGIEHLEDAPDYKPS